MQTPRASIQTGKLSIDEGTFPIEDVTFQLQDVTTTTFRDFFVLRNCSGLQRFGGFSYGPNIEQDTQELGSPRVAHPPTPRLGRRSYFASAS